MTTPTSPPGSVRPGSSSFASAWRRARLTAGERRARGQAARTLAPRSSHGRWEPAPDRPDPIALLEEQARSRVPDLVPIRYGRMLVSPFTFYRGAALIMAADLAGTPVSGVSVQLCGDAHLSNFGLFGSPERRMLFDINDFDETLRARGSGTSSGSRPVSRSWDATAASPPPTGVPSSWPGSGNTGTASAAPPGREPWTRGMTTWKPECCSSWSARRSGSSGSARARAGRLRRWWRRRGLATARGCSPGGPTRSAASCASWPTRRSSSRSRTLSSRGRNGRTRLR